MLARPKRSSTGTLACGFWSSTTVEAQAGVPVLLHSCQATYQFANLFP